MNIYGYSSLPTHNKINWSSVYIFINRRIIKDKNLLGAIKAAYQGVMAGNRFPYAILFLNIPSELLDVNVHPAKTEVRFKNNQNVRSLIINGIRQVLENSGLQTSSLISKSMIDSIDNSSYIDRKKENILKFDLQNDKINEEIFKELSKTKVNIDEIFQKNSSNQYLGDAKTQVHKTYIISQTNEGIIIIDQHAAHERLVLEHIKEQFKNSRVPSQVILVPEIITLKEKAKILLENREILNKLGLVIESFGNDDSILIRESPAILGNIDLKSLVNDIADEIIDIGASDLLNNKIEDIFSTIACHNSVRAGRDLKKDEMNAILRKMEKTVNASQCNHGRPTYIELKLKDIEKLFGRT